MISKEARTKLKNKLPRSVSYGYDRIQEKLPDLSRQQIEKAFNSDKHYREDVIKAALVVIEEDKATSTELEELIDTI